MAKFYQLSTKNAFGQIEAKKCEGSELLALAIDKAYNVELKIGEYPILLNIKDILKASGDIYKVLMDKGEVDELKDIMSRYWLHKGIPVVVLDTITTVNGIVEKIRTRAYDEKKKGSIVTVCDLLGKFGLQSHLEDFDILRLGTDGSNLEFQFLKTSTGVELTSDSDDKDELICGVIAFCCHDSCKVGSVVYRPKTGASFCGRMFTWNMKKYGPFLDSPEYLVKASEIQSWLVNKSTEKVKNIREIAAALEGKIPNAMTKNFWRSWSQRIDLGILTWLDVLDDLSQRGNDYLSHSRYLLLEGLNAVQHFNTTHVCPTCSANFKEEVTDEDPGE